MSTLLEQTVRNLKKVQEHNSFEEISSEKALLFLQVQAQLAVAQELQLLRELIADNCKRGGAFNR